MTEAQMLSKAIAIVSSEFEHDMEKHSEISYRISIFVES
jgi:hypothetical protein